ncbi:MAG: hypothetical protein LC746_10800 [Acidobacteria bacterium]|nr:hypothetical protein [Acidobacteriota bacterium]
MLTVVKRISGFKTHVGGTQHSGWLPAGAAKPLPTPVREVTFDLEIQFDGHGHLLCYASQGGELYGDTWHETLEDAELAAAEKFGIRPGQWQDDQSQG